LLHSGLRGRDRRALDAPPKKVTLCPAGCCHPALTRTEVLMGRGGSRMNRRVGSVLPDPLLRKALCRPTRYSEEHRVVRRGAVAFLSPLSMLPRKYFEPTVRAVPSTRGELVAKLGSSDSALLGQSSVVGALKSSVGPDPRVRQPCPKARPPRWSPEGETGSDQTRLSRSSVWVGCSVRQASSN
jgi:hypothetical protein